MHTKLFHLELDTKHISPCTWAWINKGVLKGRIWKCKMKNLCMSKCTLILWGSVLVTFSLCSSSWSCFSSLICSILENFKQNICFEVLCSFLDKNWSFLFLIPEFAYVLLIIPRCFAPCLFPFSHFNNCASPGRTAGRFFPPLDHPEQLPPRIPSLLFAHFSMDSGQSPWRMWGVGRR